MTTTAKTLERDVRAWVQALSLARSAVGACHRPPTHLWWVRAVGITIGLGTDRVRSAHEVVCRRYLTERERESHDGYLRDLLDSAASDLTHCEATAPAGWAEVEADASARREVQP